MTESAYCLLLLALACIFALLVTLVSFIDSITLYKIVQLAEKEKREDD
jgi:hypothetical protein